MHVLEQQPVACHHKFTSNELCMQTMWHCDTAAHSQVSHPFKGKKEKSTIFVCGALLNCLRNPAQLCRCSYCDCEDERGVSVFVTR